MILNQNQKAQTLQKALKLKIKNHRVKKRRNQYPHTDKQTT